MLDDKTKLEIASQFKDNAETIAKILTERFKWEKETCEALRIFKNPENIDLFYETIKGFEAHIIEHDNRKKFWGRVIVGLITTSIASIGSLIYFGIKSLFHK